MQHRSSRHEFILPLSCAETLDHLAALSDARVGATTFKVEVVAADGFTITRSSTDDDLPSAVVHGFIREAAGGCRVCIEGARLTPIGTRIVVAMNAVAVGIAGFIAVRGFSSGDLRIVGAVVGFLAFWATIVYLVVASAKMTAEDYTAAWLRQALLSAQSRPIQA